MIDRALALLSDDMEVVGSQIYGALFAAAVSGLRFAVMWPRCLRLQRRRLGTRVCFAVAIGRIRIGS
jgi:hypothetical protein